MVKDKVNLRLYKYIIIKKMYYIKINFKMIRQKGEDL